jgi:hypothetical protein
VQSSCGNVNWPKRTACNSCKAPRPGIAAPSQQQLSAQLADAPPGSWVCHIASCGNINWPKRTSCNSCKAARRGFEAQAVQHQRWSMQQHQQRP